METYKNIIIIFHDPGQIMKGARILRKNNIDRKTIPLPRNISSQCGICLIIEYENIKAAEDILKNEDLSFTIEYLKDVK
jgi:hypothetical protein